MYLEEYNKKLNNKKKNKGCPIRWNRTYDDKNGVWHLIGRCDKQFEGACFLTGCFQAVETQSLKGS
jgi:hypothetical protein